MMKSVVAVISSQANVYQFSPIVKKRDWTPLKKQVFQVNKLSRVLVPPTYSFNCLEVQETSIPLTLMDAAGRICGGRLLMKPSNCGILNGMALPMPN